MSEIACQLSAKVIENARSMLIRPAGKWMDKEVTRCLYFISICHQINWDYLELKIANLFEKFPRAEDITDYVLDLKESDLSEILSDYPLKDRIRSKERLKMLRQVARHLKDHYEGNFGNLLQVANFRLLGERGVYHLLDDIAVFNEDPYRKKQNVLIHELIRGGGVDFVDGENTRPAIDYHIIRSYIRTGRIYPTSSDVLNRLRSHDVAPRRRLVDEARRAAVSALQLVSQYCAMDVADVNYIEWMIGRTRCTRESPKCMSDLPLEKTNDLSPLLQGSQCCFSGFCAVNWANDWTEIWEPLFVSRLY